VHRRRNGIFASFAVNTSIYSFSKLKKVIDVAVFKIAL
jgi:hypothetical protein